MDLVIVDDHPAVRAGLRGLIEDEDDLRVAATAATAREGFEAIADARPAVALIDLHLPDDDGLSLCLRTRALPEPPRVVIYSAFADAALAVLAAIAGADAVLPKSAPPRAPARRRSAAGRGAPLDPRALRAVGARLDPDDLAILGHAGPRRGRGGDRRHARASSPRRCWSRRARDAAARGARSPPRRAPPAIMWAMPTRDQILEALKVVIDPELHRIHRRARDGPCHRDLTSRVP